MTPSFRIIGKLRVAYSKEMLKFNTTVPSSNKDPPTRSPSRQSRSPSRSPSVSRSHYERDKQHSISSSKPLTRDSSKFSRLTTKTSAATTRTWHTLKTLGTGKTGLDKSTKSTATSVRSPKSHKSRRSHLERGPGFLSARRFVPKF